MFVPSPSCAPWAGHHLHHGHQHHVQHTHISQWQCPVCNPEDFLGQLVKSIKFNVAFAMIFCEERSPARCLPLEQQQSLRFNVCCLFALSQRKSELKPHSFVMRRLSKYQLRWHEQSLNVFLSSFSIPRLEKKSSLEY